MSAELLNADALTPLAQATSNLQTLLPTLQGLIATGNALQYANYASFPAANTVPNQAAIDGATQRVYKSVAGAWQYLYNLTALPDARADRTEQLGRKTVISSTPILLRGILTDAQAPYWFTDAINNIASVGDYYIVIGEDVQIHVIHKVRWSAARADRKTDWTTTQTSQWNTEAPAWLLNGDATVDSRNAMLHAIAAERWNYADYTNPAGVTETGYVLIGGTGDRDAVGQPNRSPTLIFVRLPTDAGAIPRGQSLTRELRDAGFMNGDTTTQRNLFRLHRAALNTFYASGAGYNGVNSAPTDPVRPTFGKIVLSLNGAQDTVSSLAWTDYTAALQALMPGGETIINVPAVGDHTTGKLLVLVVTKSGASAPYTYKWRAVLWDIAANTGSIPVLQNIVSNADIFPFPVTAGQNIAEAAHNGGVVRSASGTLIWFNQDYGSAASNVFFRSDTDTADKLRDVSFTARRALGHPNGIVFQIRWDAASLRYVVCGNFGTSITLAGQMDALCKSGKVLTSFFPIRGARANDGSATVRTIFGDFTGVLVGGTRQLLVHVPIENTELPPMRVLWGLRVTPGVADAVNVSEGEALFYRAGAVGRTAPKRVYFAGGTLAVGAALTLKYTIVLKSDGTIGRLGGFNAGLDYPEPTFADQCILANFGPRAINVATSSEIDMVTFRDQ